jgi:hypothetical protein
VAVTGASIEVAPPPRDVILVLVTRDGQVLGALPAFRVAVPWWPDAEAVVGAARERFGVEVTILRLLRAELPSPPGGAVTYLAEVAVPLPTTAAVEPWEGSLDEHRLRQSWARPGGPAADVAWADSVLQHQGLERAGPAQQVRTWNLSALWRLPLRDGVAWLKVVPRFFEHEGRLLERLAAGPVPRLLGHAGNRTLMPEIPGADLYDADMPSLERMVSLLVDLQVRFVRRVDDLRGLGLPDWRGPALTEAIADVVVRTAAELSREDHTVLEAFVEGLPTRFARLAETGVPDTLVHGDFHPGNFRGDADSLVLLDWGDSGIGNPLLDQPAFLDRIRPAFVEPIRALWQRRWESAIPNSDVARATALLDPVAAARQAVIYRKFLDNIEPAEHPYHAKDPATWLAATARLLREERR